MADIFFLREKTNQGGDSPNESERARLDYILSRGGEGGVRKKIKNAKLSSSSEFHKRARATDRSID